VIIFNWIGAVMALLAGIVLFATNNGYLAAFVLALADVPYRLKFREKRDSLLAGMLDPTTGGQFFFIPCWAWAIILPVADKLLSSPAVPPHVP
jgi:hypothetical protein